jgi:hypothetical protein
MRSDGELVRACHSLERLRAMVDSIEGMLRAGTPVDLGVGQTLTQEAVSAAVRLGRLDAYQRAEGGATKARRATMSDPARATLAALLQALPCCQHNPTRQAGAICGKLATVGAASHEPSYCADCAKAVGRGVSGTRICDWAEEVEQAELALAAAPVDADEVVTITEKSSGYVAIERHGYGSYEHRAEYADGYAAAAEEFGARVVRR